MQITVLGMILFPVGAVLFIWLPMAVYYAAIFFIPFTATSLLNTGSGVPLTPGQYFGGLFILNEILWILFKGHVTPLWQRDRAVIPLFLFLVIALISVILPFALDGGVRTADTGLISEVLTYSSKSIKGTLPVVFGIIFLFFVVRRNLTADSLVRTIRVYVSAGAFVCLWGLMEFACSNVLHIKYPAFIFNNAVLASMHGYHQTVYIAGIPFSRISSVTHEPSILAKFLVTVLPILLIGAVLKMPFTSRLGHKAMLALVVGVMLLSTAATAYLGIVVSLMVTGSLLMLARIWRPRHLVLKAGVLPGILLGLAFWALPIVQIMLKWLLFEKISSGSAVQRGESVLHAWTIFEQFPVLGAGWAMVTSNDLIVYLLANVGLAGFLSFFIAVGLVLFGAFRSIRLLRNMPGFRPRLLLGLVLASSGSLASLLAVSVVTGIELYLEYFYLALALAISANIIVRRELEYGRRLHRIMEMSPSA